MRYLKLWTDNSVRPEPAEALADAILRAAEKRNLLSQWPTIGYTVDNLVDLCKGLSYPRQVPWADIDPEAPTSDDQVLARAIVQAAIAHGVTHGDQPLDIVQVLHLADCLTQIGPNDSAYMLPEQIAETGGVLWLEIQPVIEDEGMCTVIAADDCYAVPNLFTVYTHHADHLSQSVADFSTPEAAFHFADQVCLAYAAAHDIKLPVTGNLKEWCEIKDAMNLDIPKWQSIVDDSGDSSVTGAATLTFMRDDFVDYKHLGIDRGLVDHERRIDGTGVGHWFAKIPNTSGSYGKSAFPMLAVDAATPVDWKVASSDANANDPDCGNLRTAIWIVNPDCMAMAVSVARDLLHYGVSTLPKNHAGLVVSVGERHRIQFDDVDHAAKFGLTIKSALNEDEEPLDSALLATLLESAAGKVESGHVGFACDDVYSRFVAIGGPGAVPKSPEPGVVVEIDTTTKAFSAFTKEWEVARILRVASDRVAAGERDFELQDLNGESVGRLAVVHPPVLEKKQTVALQEFSSPALS